jgi:DNA-binding winged helix-turn-helix (wHTH) protein/Tfp pilus assembly protein PilF
VTASVRIGEWIADPRTNELRRGGEVARVEPKSMDVLMLLARHEGAVVTREEIFAAVWPGVVVGDEALSQAITKLRRALDDDPREPRFIETIPKRGYRLVAAMGFERRGALPDVRSLALLFVPVMIGVIAGILLPRTQAINTSRPPMHHTPRAEAYADFVRAQALFLAREPRDNLEARELYRRAVESDPRFARAYAGLAMTYAMEYRLSGSDAALDRALKLAETARDIDDGVAEVHWALGFIHTQAARYPQALESLQRAIELNPRFADAHALMGGIHTYMGEPAKSVPLLRTALRLEPEGGYLYYMLLGRAYFFEGDPEQALINLRAAVARNPADVETRIYMAAALAASGNRQGAEWEAEEIRTLQPGFSLRKWMDSYPLANEALRTRLREAVAPLFAAG